MDLNKLVGWTLVGATLLGYANIDSLKAGNSTDSGQETSENSSGNSVTGTSLNNLSYDKEIPDNLKQQINTASKRGIPAKLLLAIAIHETGHFRAVIGDGNYYGIKCLNSPKDPCSDVKTHESYCDGLCNQSFQLGKNNDFMANVIGNTIINLAGLEGKSSEEISLIFERNFDTTLDKIGQRYATDSGWSNKVRKIYNSL